MARQFQGKYFKAPGCKALDNVEYAARHSLIPTRRHVSLVGPSAIGVPVANAMFFAKSLQISLS
jgi:hypothetical protein